MENARSYLNLCRACNEDFASTSAFDRHRTGTHAYTLTEGLRHDPPVADGRRCMDDDEMCAAGMNLDSRRRWCIVADAERARQRFGGSHGAPAMRQEEEQAA